MSFDRQQVASIVEGKNIHPAFYVDHPYLNPNLLSAEEMFALKFFLHCSNEDLFILNDLAKSKPQCEEIRVKFSIKISGINSILSTEEMKDFAFSEHTWKAKILKGGLTDFRQPSKATLMVTFT